jgi:hypothetical protein
MEGLCRVNNRNLQEPPLYSQPPPLKRAEPDKNACDRALDDRILTP